MFTPNDITDRNPPRDERPYAGWLYGSIGIVSDTGSRLDHLQLTLGIVGPYSGAKDTRSEEHTSELQSLMRNSYAFFCLTKKTYLPAQQRNNHYNTIQNTD